MIRRMLLTAGSRQQSPDRTGGRGAFVEMEDNAAARKAIAALNLSDFDGRLVSVYFALSSVQSKPKEALQ